MSKRLFNLPIASASLVFLSPLVDAVINLFNDRGFAVRMDASGSQRAVDLFDEREVFRKARQEYERLRAGNACRACT